MAAEGFSMGLVYGEGAREKQSKHGVRGTFVLAVEAFTFVGCMFVEYTWGNG